MVKTDDMQSLKKTLELLVLIELSKAGASYAQIRQVMGAADNNLISKVNAIFAKKGGKTK